MTLRPQEYFTIVRGLEDHTDSGTYYVRAFVRNARTDALIDTVDLVDNGDRRFSKPWQVPADPSGEGFYIMITSIVYSDAGYTTKSGNYGEKFDTYLVQDRMNPNLGTGGGVDVDYKKIKKLIKEEVSKISLPDLKVPENDITPLLSAIRELPQPEKIDFAPLFDALKAISNQIALLPKPEEFDYERLEMGMEGVINVINGTNQQAIQSNQEIGKTLLEAVQGVMTALEDTSKRVNDYNGDRERLKKIIEAVNTELPAGESTAVRPTRDYTKFL